MFAPLVSFLEVLVSLGDLSATYQNHLNTKRLKFIVGTFLTALTTAKLQILPQLA